MNNRTPRNSYTSLDDIVVELSADLEAATKAQTETTLHPKKPGLGVAAIRAHIQKQFEHVHKDLAADLITPPQVFCDTDETPAPRRRAKPVSLDQAAKILSKHVVHVSRCHHFHQACYEIVVPTESHETLLQQAIKVVADLPENDDRYVIIEEPLSRKEDKDESNRKSSS